MRHKILVLKKFYKGEIQMLKKISDFSEADLYIFWQGFAESGLEQMIEQSLRENPATADVLEEVKTNAELWKFLELPYEPVAQWVIDEIIARSDWKYVPAEQTLEFGQLWSIKEIKDRFVVLVYVDDGEILRAIPISNQIQNSTKFDLVIDPEYLPHEFCAKYPVVKTMLEAWHDFPLLRSHLGEYLGSFSDKTCKLLNDLVLAHASFEMGIDDCSYPSYINNPDIFGHATGTQDPNEIASVSEFQLTEVDLFKLPLDF